MSRTTALPNHLRPRREKMFGEGRPRPLDRNAKVRVMTFARALMRRTEPGKHYGAITAKALAVLEALLWGFHNARSGLCFPSYETIAAKADCARSTVAEAIKALERIVSMYLDYAENQATRRIPMKMKNWTEKLDSFLTFN